MLPMCVLPSLRCKGRHDKPLPVDTSATSGQTTILEPFGLWPKIGQPIVIILEGHAMITSKDVVIKIELCCIIYLKFGLIKK